MRKTENVIPANAGIQRVVSKKIMKCLLSALIFMSSATVYAQAWIGASGNLILDGTKSAGGSIEIGWPSFGGGLLFVKGSFIERGYNQTFPGGLLIAGQENSNVNGITDNGFYFRSRQEFQGQVYDPGYHVVEPGPWIDYLADGSQLGLGVLYCYPISTWLFLGGGIGLIYRTEHAIPAIFINDVAYGAEIPNGSIKSSPSGSIYDSNYQSAVKHQFLGNLGGSIKFMITRNLLLSIEYETQTGAGLGADIAL